MDALTVQTSPPEDRVNPWYVVDQYDADGDLLTPVRSVGPFRVSDRARFFCAADCKKVWMGHTILIAGPGVTKITIGLQDCSGKFQKSAGSKTRYHYVLRQANGQECAEAAIRERLEARAAAQQAAREYRF